MRMFRFSILFQHLPECFGISVIFQPEAFSTKAENIHELLEYSHVICMRCSHQIEIISVFMKLFKYLLIQKAVFVKSYML